MAQYGTFKYGVGVKYGGTVPSIKLFKSAFTDPDKGVVARNVKVSLKYTNNGGLWRIDTVRLMFSRKAHVLPKWLVRVYRNIKRTKVSLKYTANELWRIDAIRLKQRIRHQRKTV